MARDESEVWAKVFLNLGVGRLTESGFSVALVVAAYSLYGPVGLIALFYFSSTNPGGAATAQGSIFSASRLAGECGLNHDSRGRAGSCSIQIYICWVALCMYKKGRMHSDAVSK